MKVRNGNFRKQIFEDWVKNPYTTAKKICELHGLDYAESQNYINKLLSEFRSYPNLGLPQKAQRLEHRVFEWESISRDLLPGEGDLCRRLEFFGWKEVSNNNGMWTFKGDPRGSVHWYKEGLVRLYLKGELQLAKAKELFCHAFRWFAPKEISKYLDVPLKETYRKWIFDVGAPVPSFDIRTFERSHGLRIFADGSHVTSLHVGEAQPFWLDEQRLATSELNGVVQQFGVEIKEHLKLIQLWQDEAKSSRVTRVVEPDLTVKEANLPLVSGTSKNAVAFVLQEENDFLHEY